MKYSQSIESVHPNMRILIVGNSGSGKSFAAQALAKKHRLTHLDLDTLVWVPGEVAQQRPLTDVLADLAQFCAQHRAWVIEGCYGELIAHALPECTELVFLNPGEQACIDNNRARPWEPHKYASKQEQDRMLEPLLQWVRGYYTRDDLWSLAAHRRLFDGFSGKKREITDAKGAWVAKLDF
jgi:adenylate kinase family enzyme